MALFLGNLEDVSDSLSYGQRHPECDIKCNSDTFGRWKYNNWWYVQAKIFHLQFTGNWKSDPLLKISKINYVADKWGIFSFKQLPSFKIGVC